MKTFTYIWSAAIGAALGLAANWNMHGAQAAVTGFGVSGFATLVTLYVMEGHTKS